MSEPVSTLLILGASGDLSARLLLPALGQLLQSQPDRHIRLVGAGTEEFSEEQWRERVRTSFDSSDASGPAVERVLTETTYLSADVTDAGGLRTVLGACEGVPAIYFALPPAVTAAACRSLEQVDLPEGTQLALEKPFGTDREVAGELNARLRRLVPEDQVQRIDHFLGRSTVLNVLGLRFANSIFEPLWSNQHIEKVDVVYDEQLGLENRARYYDKAGALVDMIQSHLLQVLAVLAMEPPATLDARDLRDAKATVLRATRVYNNDPVASSRRGIYIAGDVEGRTLPSYVDEDGVDASLQTETLAEVTVGVENWRWKGVPFTLRSGKALGEHRREILITFKSAEHVPLGLRGVEEPARLRLLLAPDGMSLEINVNGPGDPREIDRAVLRAEFGPGQLLAYGEVLEGIFDGDPALSVRGDTAEDCWRIVEPVIAAWKNGDVPLDEYAAGSGGPSDWERVG